MKCPECGGEGDRYIEPVPFGEPVVRHVCRRCGMRWRVEPMENLFPWTKGDGAKDE